MASLSFTWCLLTIFCQKKGRSLCSSPSFSLHKTWGDSRRKKNKSQFTKCGGGLWGNVWKFYPCHVRTLSGWINACHGWRRVVWTCSARNQNRRSFHFNWQQAVVKKEKVKVWIRVFNISKGLLYHIYGEFSHF